MEYFRYFRYTLLMKNSTKLKAGPKVGFEPFPASDRWLIGHGRLMLSAAMIEDTIAHLRAAAERSLAANPAADMKEVIRLFRLMKDFNRLLLDIGIAEIRAGEEAEAVLTSNGRM